jgi:hypothetical protein
MANTINRESTTDAPPPKPKVKKPKRICINADCGWIGFEDDCLDWKHPTGARMCPECHDNTERYTSAWAERVIEDLMSDRSTDA